MDTRTCLRRSARGLPPSVGLSTSLLACVNAILPTLPGALVPTQRRQHAVVDRARTQTQAAEAGSGAAREQAEAQAAAALERVFNKDDFRRMEVRRVEGFVRRLKSRMWRRMGALFPTCLDFD